MQMIAMQDLPLANQRILIRQDLNVPVSQDATGQYQVTSDARLKAALPTLLSALERGAKVMVTSHLGRPTEGQWQQEYSLAPVVAWLQNALPYPVSLATDWLKGVVPKSGELLVLENCRFNIGEKANDKNLSQTMASLCDVYVNDAFGTAHRAQASTYGVAEYAPIACAGPLMMAELDALNLALSQPKKPLLAIVGGSKVSTKLTVLEALCDKVDRLIVGGGIANTFIAAAGYSVGKSLYEADLIPQAKALMQKTDIPMPTDVVVSNTFSAEADARICRVDEVQADEMILDLGPDTAKRLASNISQVGTIIWNGPLGVFEFDQFGHATKALAHAIAKAKNFSIAGGGDTLAAIDKYDIAAEISYISTGGGAFLEFVEGKTLPAIEILQTHASHA